MSTVDDSAGFDQYATNYHDALNRGLKLSGETADFFARERVAIVARLLQALGTRPERVLDFGCGVGSTVPYLLSIEGVQSATGTDSSEASLEVARERLSALPATFVPLTTQVEGVDLAYCNGVFHHIPPAARRGAVDYLARALEPGALLAFWENNPWNPGTRLIMSRIPFDRDAEVLSPPTARKLLASGGFEIVRTEYAFVFPKALRFLRPLERWLRRVPIGAQYLVLARAPG